MAKRSKQVLKVHDGGKEGAVGRWITEEHKLSFAQGAPKIFRTRNSGENWSFSMWVKEKKIPHPGTSYSNLGRGTSESRRPLYRDSCKYQRRQEIDQEFLGKDC